MRLGATPVTGPVQSIDHRSRLLQMKVVDFHRKQMLIYESQRRQQWRADVLPHDAALLKSFSRQHRSDCLRHALEAKDMNRICLVVEAGADPSTEVRGGLSPLLAAVLKRSVPDVRRLLAAGADINSSSSQGMTALMWAVKRGDYAMVDALLEERADTGVEGCSGWTAVSIASRHGRRDIVQLIVETLRRDKISGEMNATRALNHRSAANAGLTPLAVAAIHRNEAMARCLLRLGAKPGVKCHQGYVAGEHAAKAGWTVFGLWLQETQAFGDNGVYTFADINAENALRAAEKRMLEAISSGVTVEDDAKSKRSRPTSSASNSRPGSAIVSKRPASSTAGGGREQISATMTNTNLLTSAVSPAKAAAAVAGAAAEQEPELVSPPMVWTPSESGRARGQSGFLDATNFQLEQVRSNTLLTIAVLQEGRAAPDAETDSGQTALMSAVYRGRLNSVRSLIQEGADPNYSNRNGRTALMAAAAVGDHKATLLLLRHGANAAVMDIHGKVAGAYAFERGFHQLAELLAIAASDGHEAAVDWEVDRSRREEEEKDRQRMEDLLDKVHGGGGGSGSGGNDIPEEDLYDWMIRVTKPREAARRADKKQADHLRISKDSLLGASSDSIIIGRPHNAASPSGRGERCPKCTLFVPCLHFDGTKLPEGVAAWSAWSRRGGPSRKGNRARTGILVDSRSSDDRNVAWWSVLHRAHRDRSRPPAKD